MASYDDRRLSPLEKVGPGFFPFRLPSKAEARRGLIEECHAVLVDDGGGLVVHHGIVDW